jgi:hypothetical protein
MWFGTFLPPPSTLVVNFQALVFVSDVCAVAALAVEAVVVPWRGLVGFCLALAQLRELPSKLSALDASAVRVTSDDQLQKFPVFVCSHREL